jgi:4-hydroxy-2-oxoheptanedioate aldolase
MATVGLRARLAKGRGLLNGYCMLPCAFAAEVYARQGFDLVTVDLQHGLSDYSSMLSMLQAITACDVVPMVRVPWLEPGIIMKALDAGALGITCPMIGTAEDAERLVRYASYPPRGERSLGPIRASAIYGPSYAKDANGIVATIAMIETASGVANVDAIARVEGLTGIYVGPGDLAASLGRPAFPDRFDEVVDGAVEKILTACRTHGLVSGTFAATPERARDLVARGFDFVTLNTDVSALQSQAAAWVSAYRSMTSA